MPSDATKLTMQELFEQTSEELATAYIEENRIETGTYLGKVLKLYGTKNADDADRDPGRIIVSVHTQLLDRDDPTEKKGNTFIRVSPEPRYSDRNGKLDSTSNRFMELAKAVGANPANTQEVFTKAAQTMFLVRGRETYVVPEEDLHPSHADKAHEDGSDAWVSLDPEDTEEREYYLDLGYEPKFMVDRVTKVKVRR